MKKRKLKIINFLYLTDEEYNKIREYRNQKYIRDISLNSKTITKKEHRNYKKLLIKRENHFAFLILNKEIPYGVVTLRKDTDGSYYVGDYIIKEIYKYEGGGIVNRFCISKILNYFNIRFVKAYQKISNTRANRGGAVFTLEDLGTKNGYTEYLSEVPNFNDVKIINTKARKVFDKLYEFDELLIN